MMKKKNILLPLVLLVMAMPAMGQSESARNFDSQKYLDVFNTIYKHLDLMYVDTIDAREVVGTGIKSMLRSLDPYTEYYPEEKLNELKSMLTGNLYAGIGSTIHYNSKIKRVCIYQPYEGFPAAEAGLRLGDIILSIDDTTMTDKSLDYVSSHLRGEAGTSFKLKIKRPSTGKTMTMKITRRQIQDPTIPYYGLQSDSIGYLMLSGFTENSARQVRRAIIEMKRQGMKGLVFDLRENGGGSEQEAVSIVNMFVPKGLTIVSNRGKLKRSNREYRSTVEPIDTVMPVVVLVNDGSASASEITSGALQDLDRAVILGTRTYGKGLVQSTVDLPYNGSLKLTTNKYYIPSGRCIQAINYRHARGGYTEHIPDSLTHVFSTKNGRKVRDGGGIQPDVEVKPDSLPNIVYYLQAAQKDSADVLFNFESDFVKTHASIGEPQDFELSDADYDEFKRRVVESGFTYDPETEKLLKNLKRMAQFEGYFDEARTEFENLEKKLQHDVARDLDHYKPVIKQMIGGHLVAVYHYQAGAIRFNLKYDRQMQEACRLLNNPDEYRKLLIPQNDADTKKTQSE